MKRAIFPGSFDPFTIGHYDIVMRGLQLFDEIIIGVGQNGEKSDHHNLQTRIDAIRHTFADEPRVSVRAYSTLTVDFAQEVDAHFILRGVRNTRDFEYEQSIAEANRQMTGIETLLLYTRPEYAHISSTLVRDLMHYGKDVTPLSAPDKQPSK